MAEGGPILVASDNARPVCPEIRSPPEHFAKRRSQLVGKSGRLRVRPIVWPRALVAVAVGAVYGLLALEAISPVGILLVGWMVAILVLAWRLPLKARVVTASAGALVVGFGLLWSAVLETQLANCKPPTCATGDPSTDVLMRLASLLQLSRFAARRLVSEQSSGV